MKYIKNMIDVNLVESFNMVKVVLPGMKNRIDQKPVSIACFDVDHLRLVRY